jgi:hypothetical protein
MVNLIMLPRHLLKTPYRASIRLSHQANILLKPVQEFRLPEQAQLCCLKLSASPFLKRRPFKLVVTILSVSFLFFYWPDRTSTFIF